MKVLSKYKQLILGLAVAAIVMVGGVLLLTGLARQQEPQSRQSAAVSDRRAGYVSYTGQKDKTALAQLKETVSGVVTKSSDYGEYVQSIGEDIGGVDDKYWSFYVNGKMASVGAGSYVAKGGEKIEWKFEKAQ